MKLGIVTLLSFGLLACSGDDDNGSDGSGGASGGSTGGAAGSGPGGTGGSAGSAGASGSAGSGGSAGGAGGASGGSTGGAAGSAGSVGGAGGAGGAGGSTGGAAGSGGGCSAAGDLSDEFDDACTLGAWTEQHFAATASSWDIHQTLSGHLVIEFSSGTPSQSGWFEDFVGPLIYKATSGDFLVVTRVNAGRVGDPSLAPTAAFNSAGLLVRDPSSAPGSQNWLMHNIGSQNGTSNGGCPNAGASVGVGSEAKTTVSSSSTLCLNPGSHSGQIAICRVGADFSMLRKLDDEASWTETNSFNHPGIGSAVEVGLMANAWGVPPDIRADFDWIRFSSVSGAADCSPSALDAAFP